MNLNNFMSRLAFEKEIMKQELPQFFYYHNSGKPYLSGWQSSSVGIRNYHLKLQLSMRYPDKMPDLYITSPITLYSFTLSKTINEMGLSHAFHTSGNGPDGCVKICHFSPANWDASKTCVGVFFKGILWIEAYEHHLSTGKTIADILNSWKRRL